MKIYSSEISGSLKVRGDIKAENYIVQSTVTQLTQSFISGSTISGDSADDTHQFTGSLLVTGSNLTIDSVGTVSGSSTSTGSFGNVNVANHFSGFSVGNVISMPQENSGVAFQIRRYNSAGNAIKLMGGSGASYAYMDFVGGVGIVKVDGAEQFRLNSGGLYNVVNVSGSSTSTG